MRNNKVLIVVLSVIIILLLFIFSICFFGGANIQETTCQTTEDNEDNIIVNIPIERDVILSSTDDKGWDYIEKIFFVGDSTTYHFYKAGIEKSHILVPENYTLTLSFDINDIIVGEKGLTIAQSLNEANAEIVIITVGVNGADSFTEQKYKTYYKKLIREIREQTPNTAIIIQSVFPVTKSFSDRNGGVTNFGIDRLNEWAKELAIEENVKYLDTQSILKDENGAQLECYSVKDGVHMNSDAYNAIIEYIKTHALE